jgi:hypothetical protein
MVTPGDPRREVPAGRVPHDDDLLQINPMGPGQIAHKIRRIREITKRSGPTPSHVADPTVFDIPTRNTVVCEHSRDGAHIC